MFVGNTPEGERPAYCLHTVHEVTGAGIVAVGPDSRPAGWWATRIAQQDLVSTPPDSAGAAQYAADYTTTSSCRSRQHSRPGPAADSESLKTQFEELGAEGIDKVEAKGKYCFVCAGG